MTSELDKKIQKTQTDLVQSVLEAFEKRNFDRVDMLISNAIKQLKMSRFKPDQSTCISLIYLARMCPKLFAQSATTKELLKSHIKRDNGNIKGTKNDTVLPLLSANILLACCDSNDVKTIILNRLEQWLSSNQKPAEMMLHLLAVLCMKSQGDQQTVETLIEMRQHWQQYFEDNFELYGSMPTDICVGMRKLIYSRTNCETLIDNLKFLIKHDHDIVGLSKEVSEFVVGRPITINCMLENNTNGEHLYQLLLTIYNKLFGYLKRLPEHISKDTESVTTNSLGDKAQISKPDPASNSSSKMVGQVTGLNGMGIENVKLESKLNAESSSSAEQGQSKNETNIKSDETNASPNEKNQMNFTSSRPPLYMRIPSTDQTVAVDRVTMEAILNLLTSLDMERNNRMADFGDLLGCWFIDFKSLDHAFICEDVCMTTAYQLPIEIRRKLIHSSNNCMIELALHRASPIQLAELLQQFGLALETVNRILKELESVKDIGFIDKLESVYFYQLMDFYIEMGALGAKELCQRIGTAANL